MSGPVNEQLHALLTSLEQLAGQSRIAELGLDRPIAELALALTEQRLELVHVQAELREVLRMTRFLAGALLAMDARRQAEKPVMLPVAVVEQLRRWIAEAIRDEQDRDVGHTSEPLQVQSVK